MSRVVLPRLLRVTLTGFAPLFEDKVDIKFPKGPFVILGGNAMGKTTTLQAIIFGLAGGADKTVEETKSLRWGAKYFRGRLVPDQTTQIRIEFELGESKFVVTRGVWSDDVESVKINGDPSINDSEVANAQYETEVIKAGGYARFSDFRFIVHRLSYLPETRRSLVWDQKAQIRTVMLVCSDAQSESDFRRLNGTLRDLDTKKRHLHVDITRLQTRIDRLESTQAALKKVSKAEDADQHEQLLSESERLRAELSEFTKRRIAVLRRTEKLRAELSGTGQHLEALQDELADAENSFTLRTLKTVESASSAVGLQKLLVYHLCPYCAQRTNELAAQAQRRIADGDCPICTQPYNSANGVAELEILREQISAANQLIETYDRQHDDSRAELRDLSEAEHATRLRLEEIVGQLPPIPAAVEELNIQSVASLRRTLQIYQSQHARLAARWEETKRSVDAAFARFTDAASKRLTSLQRAASKYGHDFLGRPCEFIAVPARSELGSLSFFVPKFADEERRSPETCSESERFFLDIAFRMALLELAGELSNTSSTFVCETPETALDLAYTKNVSEMFSRFAQHGFSLVLSANIQLGGAGVAAPLLKKYPPEERRRRVFNLLEAGFSSEVQTESATEFRAQVRRIMTSPSRNGTTH